MGIEIAIPLLLGVIFYGLGLFYKKLKPGWWFGIRTPWTLSNSKVWVDTHLRGATLFKLLGVWSAITIFIPQESFLFILLPLIGIEIYLWAYSYKLSKGGI